MLKTFVVRTIALSNTKPPPNFKTFTNSREGQIPFTKTKKSKKMLRTWEFTNDAMDSRTQLRENNQPYRLVSYNILAQDLLVEHLYLYRDINTQHLRWDHRMFCIQNELSYLNPDIMCIQEMQFNHIKEFVGRLSHRRRLEYVFKKKTGHRTDGCAIIYDKAKFKLIAEKDVEFYKPSSNKLNRENIAILARFKLCHEPEKEIVIATTHLLFNPRRHDVRVAQVELLLEALNKFSLKQEQQQQEATIGDDHRFPVLLTGDFNSELNSPPFIKLTTSYKANINEQHQVANSIDNCENNKDEKKANENEEKNSKMVESGEEKKNFTQIPFKLSALDFGRSCASTHHDRWITVDFVLRSMKCDDVNEKRESSEVKVLSIYKLPSVNNCERIGKIPNQYLGSDHYLQAIDFIVV